MVKRDDWVEQFPAAITLCDRAGTILAMNQRAAETFAREGGKGLIGSNVLDCHPEAARAKLRDLMATERANVYTIEKDGARKLVYQSPWYDDGQYAGFVEMVMHMPAELPHFIRESRPNASPVMDGDRLEESGTAGFAAHPPPLPQHSLSLQLTILPDRFALCRLAPGTPIPAWILALPFYSLTRTDDEVSLLLPEDRIRSSWKVETGWRGLQVAGPLDLAMIGILSSLSATLAQAGISTFVISTYDTDYVFVRESALAAAVAALEAQGHGVRTEV